MGRLFGTDGVRGLAGSELTADLARGLGAATVRVLGSRSSGRPVLVVGRDPRTSGRWLEEALVDGIVGMGGDVLLTGVLPTPAIAFLTADHGASAGIVVSASHNSAEYNGIKVFAADGFKLPDEQEDAIEVALGEPDAGEGRGSVARMDGPPVARYLEHLEAAVGSHLHGMTVVVDCANGAASQVAPELYRRLGATVHPIHAEPDGENINGGCGALHPEVVAAEVVRIGADAGVTHDGDADRALFADAAGRVIDGDQVLAACALELHSSGSLPGDSVVTTVMANLGFQRAMQEAGVRTFTTAVGDRYVVEEMLRTGTRLGGEQSGHLVFLDDATTGDGLLTAARFLSLAAQSGASVADLAARMRRYPQVMLSIPVRDREGLVDAEDVHRAIRSATDSLGDAGRVLVRPSGTEHVVRIMVEAESEEIARAHAEAVASAVRAALS